ncbi:MULTISPECIES: hypothetical protein [Carnobacterium]|jgi:predicted small secreted protein|uniref:hypothetical protein n=1 Tax=Carnobacterium TaxID=2747 RepID=UPI000E747A5C|nr:hypothetical protein [Carnobacterium maltaromaticum]AOA02619.1 hypothetical protein BFC23_08925 [Carnobacterium maltaromaticum]MCI1820596.1 hypothetical protein [Carnobacterium maltaromaticum]
MKRKRWIILICLVLITVCVGTLYLTIQKNIEEQKIIEVQESIEAQRMSVLKLKETFAGIESVKFNKAHYNSLIEGYMMDVTLNYQSGTYLPMKYFNYWEKSQQIGGFTMGVGHNENEGVTLKKVKVTFLNGDESEI